MSDKAEQRPKTLSDLYQGPFLDPRFGTKKVYAWFQQRHKITRSPIDEEGIYRVIDPDTDSVVHEWKVPLGVRYALKHPLIHNQLVQKYPWYVTWQSPKTGKRLKKYFMGLPAAIHFIATQAQYVDPQACIVSRNFLYDILPKLRDKIPKPWYWCPGCMTARKYYIVYPEQYFTVLKKTWSEEKRRFIWPERKLRLIRCKFCGCTNRDSHFRRSNQPWEKRRFKRGVTRAKRR